MSLRPFLSASAALALLFASGCRDEKIAIYRVPRETPPSLATPDAASGATAAPADAGPLTWQAPAGWAAQPLGPMRKGSFLVKGPDGATADVSIIAFPGAAGGLIDNLNRWRGQLKLPPLPAEALDGATTRLAAGDLQFTVVDFAGQGADGPARILGAVLPLGDETYFFKLMGPAALAEQSRPAFLAFLKTVKTR